MSGSALLALTSALGFGTAGVLMRRGLQHTTPLAAAAVSVTVTTAFIWLLALATVDLAHVLTWKIAPFLVAGLVAPGLGRLFLFEGVHRVGVARTAAVASGAPIVSVALAIAFLGERPSRLLLLGVACIVVGGVLLSYRHANDLSWRRRNLFFPVLAALAFAVRDVISRWGLRDYTEPLIAAAVAAATSLAVMWLVAAVRGGAYRMPAAGLRFVALSGLAEGVAYLTMWWALSLSPVSFVSPLVNAHSIFAVALAALFLRDLERVTWRIAFAAGLIVAGVFVVVRFGA